MTCFWTTSTSTRLLKTNFYQQQKKADDWRSSLVGGQHVHYPDNSFFEMEICLQSIDGDRKMIVLTTNERGISFLDKRGIPEWYGKAESHDPNFTPTLIASADPDESP